MLPALPLPGLLGRAVSSGVEQTISSFSLLLPQTNFGAGFGAGCLALSGLLEEGWSAAGWLVEGV